MKRKHNFAAMLATAMAVLLASTPQEAQAQRRDREPENVACTPGGQIAPLQRITDRALMSTFQGATIYEFYTWNAEDGRYQVAQVDTDSLSHQYSIECAADGTLRLSNGATGHLREDGSLTWTYPGLVEGKTLRSVMRIGETSASQDWLLAEPGRRRPRWEMMEGFPLTLSYVDRAATITIAQGLVDRPIRYPYLHWLTLSSMSTTSPCLDQDCVDAVYGGAMGYPRGYSPGAMNFRWAGLDSAVVGYQYSWDGRAVGGIAIFANPDGKADVVVNMPNLRGTFNQVAIRNGPQYQGEEGRGIQRFNFGNLDAGSPFGLSVDLRPGSETSVQPVVGLRIVGLGENGQNEVITANTPYQFTQTGVPFDRYSLAWMESGRQQRYALMYNTRRNNAEAQRRRERQQRGDAFTAALGAFMTGFTNAQSSRQVVFPSGIGSSYSESGSGSDSRVGSSSDGEYYGTLTATITPPPPPPYVPPPPAPAYTPPAPPAAPVRPSCTRETDPHCGMRGTPM